LDKTEKMLCIYPCNINALEWKCRDEDLQKEAMLSFLFANVSFDCFPKVRGFHDARERCVTSGLR